MGWKIQIDSDTCPYLNKWEINCCHHNNFMKPCYKADCPLKPMTKEEAEKLVMAYKNGLLYQQAAWESLGDYERDQADSEVGQSYNKLIAALTGKEEV